MNNLSVLLNEANNFESQDAILKNAFEAISDRNFKNDLESELQEKYNIFKKPNTKKSIFTINKLWFSAAAAIVLVLVSVYFINLNLSNVDVNQLVMETKMQHPGISKGISGNSVNLNDAISAFNKEDWQKAISGFELESSTDVESQFFLGLSYLYNKQYLKSSEILSKPLFENSLYKEEVKWFLGLSFYLSNDRSKANDVLSKIKVGEWQYDNAQKLLK